MGKLNVDGTEIQILQIEEDGYISLTDMVRKIDLFSFCHLWKNHYPFLEICGILRN